MPRMLAVLLSWLLMAAGLAVFFIKKRTWAMLSLACVLVAALLTPAETNAQLPTTPLYAGMHRLTAEVVSAPEQRAIGLMGRKSLPENQGMLFVFEQPATQCFWMKNTFVSLSIAFLRDDGTITNIADMQPLTTNSHCSSEPVRFAVEVNQGWFAKRNIKPGHTIRGLPAKP